jgi:hypothetical protein
VSSEVFVLSLVTLCLRFDEKIEEYRLRVQQLATPPHGFVASQDYLTKAAEAAMKARELEDRGPMAKAKEAYLIAIEYLKMAKRPFVNDDPSVISCRKLVQA